MLFCFLIINVHLSSVLLLSGVHTCFHCKQSEGTVRRCHVAQCGKFYHEACIRLNPLTVFDNKGFRCPLHTCLGCYYGSRIKAKSTKGEAPYAC